MKIIDFKESGLTLEGCTKHFAEVDDKLLKCNSLEEQRNTLLEKYNKTFRRDELICREKQLENKFEFDSKKVASEYYDLYKTFFVSFIIAVVGLLLDNNLLQTTKNLLFIALPFFIYVIYRIFKYFLIKNKDDSHQKEIPVYEINKIELNMITKLLSSNKTEYTDEELKSLIEEIDTYSPLTS